MLMGERLPLRPSHLSRPTPSAGAPRATPRESECGRVFRDGLRARREAPGARRGSPGCADPPARAWPTPARTSLYDEITTKILAELEAGRVPWVQPWGTTAAKAPLAMPKNAATSRL